MDFPSPTDFANEAADLLLPHVRSIDDRKDLLQEAFATTHSYLQFTIRLEADHAHAFAFNCIQTLASSSQGEIYLGILLRTLSRRYGEPQRTQIQHLLETVPEYCTQFRELITPSSATLSAPLPSNNLVAIVKLIARYFNEDELKDLCLTLGVDYEDLPSVGKSNKARELVLYLNRRGQMVDLATAFTSARPQIDWPVPLTQQHLHGRPITFLSYADEDADFARKIAAHLTHSDHAVDLARDYERGSDSWLTATAEALSNAYAVVLLVGERTANDRWTRLELLAALDKRKTIIPVMLSGGQLPSFLPPETIPIEFRKNKEEQLTALLLRIPNPPDQQASESWKAVSSVLLERMRELRYMDRLKLEELRNVAQYTRLSGKSQLGRGRGDRLELPAVVVRQEMIHARWRRDVEIPVEVRRFEDAVPELKAIGRAVLLGDPGAGKTTTLFKLAADLIDVALLDRNAPIPLLLRLGLWTDPAEPFASFLRRSADELGSDLPVRLAGKRVALLLDGLNEIPADQQSDKYMEIKKFLSVHSHLSVVVTCRELDYPPDRDLALDRITIAPLDAVRIFEFIHNYLDLDYGPKMADDLFWQLAGTDAAQTYGWFSADIGNRLDHPLSTFWLAEELPTGVDWKWNWGNWRIDRNQPSSLLLLAQNPYVLFMLLDVHRTEGHRLPTNRGELFDSFVEMLLLRERLFISDPQTGNIVRLAKGVNLLKGLTDFAYEMQRERASGAVGGGMTALPLDTTSRFLNETQRKQASSANLLTLGPEVRFSHQLLQEYFVARAMRSHIFESTGEDIGLRAEDIWMDGRWWVSTNWEEATILLAGLYSDDCSAVLDWVADANPEVAARCLVESGARATDSTKLALRERWKPLLTNTKRNPDAKARAAIGRALGMVTLDDGTPLDDRHGVGITIRNNLKVPDIAWGRVIPSGNYTIGGDKEANPTIKRKRVKIKKPYQLARYPVTFVQFDCFVSAPDFDDERWWSGMPPEEEDNFGTRYGLRKLSEPSFKFSNNPRESVSWYQAVAFCRWLSEKLDEEINLPHEYEWEIAARYPEGRFFPWGNNFDPTRANTYEDHKSWIGRTTAVGIYPKGMNPALGIFDLSGNVWEWCMNKFDEPEGATVDGSSALRVVRGGSWNFNQNFARSGYRNFYLPFNRDSALGFRVVRRFPSQLI